MNDFDLDTRLKSYQAPEPSALLKARILKAATTQPVQKSSFTRRFMPIAASLIAVCAISLATFQAMPQTEKTETAAWKEAATDLGFGDIYEWVEAEDASTS
jgi:hypothetical protein